jgi:hypothetical protein
MVGTVRRSGVLFALIVSLIVGAAASMPAAADTSSAGDLIFHAGIQKMYFQYKPASAPALQQAYPKGDGCSRTFPEGAPDLMDVAATAPGGATVGRWRGKLGVCFSNERPSARSGRIDGDRGEELTLTLGSDASVSGTKIQNADLVVQGQGTLNVSAYLAGSLIGSFTFNSVGATPVGTGKFASTYAVPADFDSPFDQLVMTTGAASFFALAGGHGKSANTIFHLETTSGTLNPGETAPPANGGGNTATLTYNTGGEPIDYTLVTFTSPDGTRNVELTKPSDSSQRFTMTIEWAPEPFCDFTVGACPHTQIDPDSDGPLPLADAHLCQAGEPNATVLWCITDQHYSVVPFSDPQQIQLTETFAGWGDTHFVR